MPTDNPLHLLRLQLDLPKLLRRGTARFQKDVDLGYLVHCALGDLFGDFSPGPFRILDDTGRQIAVLAYSRHPADTLREQAERFADPAVYEACDWTHLAGKPLPEEWPHGHQLAFEARVCPVVRRRQGGETDVFLARCLEEGPGGARLSREKIYREWLLSRRELAGIDVAHLRLERFERARLLRRRHGLERSATRLERPGATVQGELRIRDGGAFRHLLERGIGRHRAFGFGMVLLRPLRRI